MSGERVLLIRKNAPSASLGAGKMARFDVMFTPTGIKLSPELEAAFLLLAENLSGKASINRDPNWPEMPVFQELPNSCGFTLHY
jgi:hypothetical protein